jgi:hypothetical protein
MKKQQSAILIVGLLCLQLFLSVVSFHDASGQTTSKVYVGVDIAYGSVEEARAEIDRVYSFTNFVVFGSTQVTWFPNRVNSSFQYAYDMGLSFVSLPPSLPDSSDSSMLNKAEWYSWAQSTWGSRFLGTYVSDEPGGRQLDGVGTYVTNPYLFPGGSFGNSTNPQGTIPSDYAEAASRFTAGVSGFLNSQRASYPLKAFTSDYAFYWYDYKAGYDVIWTELGGNYSQQVNIALCRGAAESHNKDWGAIITWSYTNYPWIESGAQLYEDMVLAYDNGAKYIVVFDSDENGHSILQQEHLDAMQRFWDYAQTHQPQISNSKSERVAYVLPDAYGFGFRWPTDHIWGIWQADDLSTNISKSVGALLDIYGENLDIIYNENLQSGTNGYDKLIYWNVYDPAPSPTPLPTPTATPVVSPTASPPPTEPFSPATIAAAVVISAFLCGLILFIFFRRHNR